jgi:peptidoglycan-N-acetylglucosamine deacetylase
MPNVNEKKRQGADHQRLVRGESRVERRARLKNYFRTLPLLAAAVATVLIAAAAIAVGVWPMSHSTTSSCSSGSIALTFDDGPDIYTPDVLDLLAQHGVKASFFVIGKKASKRPELIRRMIAEGHRVENHSWSHPHLPQLTPTQVTTELSSATAAIMAAGAPPPVFVRAPFGEVNPAIQQIVSDQHLKVIRWTIDTNDWRGASPHDIARAVLDRPAPDAVVLMHDGLRETPNTLQALPEIITGLRAAGYCLGFPIRHS